MNTLPKVIKYLNKYAFSQWRLEYNKNRKYKIAIVIPAIAEYENIRKLLKSFLSNDHNLFSKTLIIFVINNNPLSSTEIRNDNKKSLALLRAITNKSFKSEDQLIEKLIKSRINLGIVDASSQDLEMPGKLGGVGLARKIGMDLSLTTFDYSTNEKNVLVCLDADCLVSKNYLFTIYSEFNNKNLSAAYVKFEHQVPENKNNLCAITCYEIFLRYYVLGLKFASSHYAFHTIGSTIICDYESYIKVEGMNKRKAAEDFYFIEKLAKVVQINYIDYAFVYPSGRASMRVPFGTGQRITRYLSQTQNEYLLYNLNSFIILKKWLHLFHSEEMSSKQFLKKAEKINDSLFQFLLMNAFEKNWDRIVKNSKTNDQLIKQKIFWFDGFKTLKLIHFLRDNEFPLKDMFFSLDKLFELMKLPEIERLKIDNLPPIEIQREYLKVLRKYA